MFYIFFFFLFNNIRLLKDRQVQALQPIIANSVKIAKKIDKGSPFWYCVVHIVQKRDKPVKEPFEKNCKKFHMFQAKLTFSICNCNCCQCKYSVVSCFTLPKLRKAFTCPEPHRGEFLSKAAPEGSSWNDREHELRWSSVQLKFQILCLNIETRCCTPSTWCFYFSLQGTECKPFLRMLHIRISLAPSRDSCCFYISSGSHILLDLWIVPFQTANSRLRSQMDSDHPLTRKPNQILIGPDWSKSMIGPGSPEL